MEKELQKEYARAPMTPIKPIPARPGFKSANGEWKKHLGQSFQHMDLQKFLNFDAMISNNIGRSCLCYSEDMLGRKGAETGGSGPSPILDHSDGSENICLMYLLGMPGTIPALSEPISMASCPRLGSPMRARGAVGQAIPRICTEIPATPHPINTEAAHKATLSSCIKMPITPPPMKTQAAYQTIQGNIFQIFASPQHDGPYVGEETISNKSQCNVSLDSDSVLKPNEQNSQKRQHNGEIGSSKKWKGSRSRMKKHRPKVVVEGKPKRALKAHTPKAPKTPNVLSSKRKRGVVAKSCKRVLNFNLKDQENVVEFQLQESHVYTEMSTHSTAVAEVNKGRKEQMVEHRVNLPITNQSGCMYNSLRVYQRKLHINQCQKNSRKLGPNFPRICKKKRTRRQKAAAVKFLWCINAENDERQVKQELARHKQFTKRHLVQQTSWKRVKKRTKKSKVCSNSAIISCSYHANYRFLPWAALNDPEAFECVLSLPPIAVSRRKRSELTRKHILPTPLKIPEQFSLAPILDFGKHGINEHEGKASTVQLTEGEYFRIGTQNTMEVSFDNPMAFNGRVDNCLEIQKYPLSVLDTENYVDHSFEIQKFPAKQEVSLLNIEDCAPLHQDVLSTNENKEPIPSADTYGSFQRGLADVIQKLESLHINEVQALIKVNLPRKYKKTVAKVDLDEETLRVWNLLKENGDQPFERMDKDKEEWWEKQREVFRGRVDSFVARMHAIQGDRRFSRWKGSVVDSVVGVYLTQNVSDHLSSNAFMSLAAKFPKSTSNCSQTYVVEEIAYSQESVGSSVEAYRQGCGRNGTELSIDYLTQNVSDHLSRSTFMSLAESFSPKSTSNCSETYVVEEIVCNQEFVESCIEADRQMCDRSGSGQDTGYRFGDSISHEISETKSETIVSNTIPSQKLDVVEEIAYSQVSVGSSIEADRQVCDRNASDQDTGYRFGDNITGEISETKSEQIVSKEIPSQKLKGPFFAESSITYNELSFGEQQKLEMESYLQKWTVENENLPSNESQEDGNLKLSGRKCGKQRSLNDVHSCPEPCTKSLPFDLNVGLSDPSEKVSPAIQNNSQHQARNRVVRNKAETTPGKKKSKVEEKQETKIDWDELRKSYCKCRERESGNNSNTSDSVDWEAVRCSTEAEISETIKARGMNNVLAKRIKEFLDRIYKDHGSLDLEWLRDVPPEKAKEYLLSIEGIGLKSVECVRLLTLHHLAFPVDTNVARVAVRLGWVPLQSLPESVPFHLLNAYPPMDSIQKYLWPRLRTLSQLELYELHYQMITFGKVFCTKRNPNCNACPMKGECRHYASKVASSRLLLTKPEGESTVASDAPFTTDQNLAVVVTPPTPPSFPAINKFKSSSCTDQASEPIIEVPPSPEPESRETLLIPDIEDLFIESDDDEMPTIRLDTEEFRENVHSIFESNNLSGQGSEISKGLVALSHGAASARVPKLKHVGRLRTVHQVYELPDSHPILARFERREPDDLFPYLLAIWTTEISESAESFGESLKGGKKQESERYRDGSFSSSCTAIHAHDQESVWGTILIPCRTATGGFFPLNATYFQVNEVFADDKSSQHPIRIPRAWIWNLPRRLLFCGASATSIFKGLSMEETCYCFWNGYICVRGFDRTTRAPRPLSERLHFSTADKTRAKYDDE